MVCDTVLTGEWSLTFQWSKLPSFSGSNCQRRPYMPILNMTHIAFIKERGSKHGNHCSKLRMFILVVFLFADYRMSQLCSSSIGIP